MPGLFTRLRMPIEKQAKALLVDERAIGADQTGTFVLAVNSENLVEKRSVVVGQLQAGLVVIEDGIQADDRVVVRGLQRARPGAPAQVRCL